MSHRTNPTPSELYAIVATMKETETRPVPGWSNPSYQKNNVLLATMMTAWVYQNTSVLDQCQIIATDMINDGDTYLQSALPALIKDFDAARKALNWIKARESRKALNAIEAREALNAIGEHKALMANRRMMRLRKERVARSRWFRHSRHRSKLPQNR